METAGEQAALVERPQVRHILDHTERTGIAARIGTDATRIAGVDIAADMAGDQMFVHRFQRAQQRRERRIPLLEQMEHRPPRRTRP